MKRPLKPLYKKSAFFAEKRGPGNLLVAPQNRPSLRFFVKTLVAIRNARRAQGFVRRGML